MTTKAEFKQDMPPPGGYKNIPYKRVPAKSFFGGKVFKISDIT